MRYKCLAVVVVSALVGCGKKAEVAVVHSSIGCYELVGTSGSFDFSIGTNGQISASQMSVQLNPDVPTDEGKSWPKLTEMKFSAYRDSNGNGMFDEGEPGNEMKVGGEGTPPSGSASIGGGSVAVGTGGPGAVKVDIDIVVEGGVSLGVFSSTFY